MSDYLAENKDAAFMIEKEQKKMRKEVTDMYIAARKSKKLTQEKVAEIGGIKRPNITRFENGQYNPTLDMLVKVAECMDMKVEIKLVEKDA